MSIYLEEQYFEWLYSQACSLRLKNPARTYWKLFRVLFTKEFTWFVPNDDNRVEDGRALRYECLDGLGIDPGDVDPDWLEQGVSFLEVLVGMSRRLAFLTSGDPAFWFWKMLENIGLRQYNDKTYMSRDLVEIVLDKVISRSYKASGQGGLFPLHKAGRNQRNVELWYQLNAYVEEQAL